MNVMDIKYILMQEGDIKGERIDSYTLELEVTLNGNEKRTEVIGEETSLINLANFAAHKAIAKRLHVINYSDMHEREHHARVDEITTIAAARIGLYEEGKSFTPASSGDLLKFREYFWSCLCRFGV